MLKSMVYQEKKRIWTFNIKAFNVYFKSYVIKFIVNLNVSASSKIADLCLRILCKYFNHI